MSSPPTDAETIALSVDDPERFGVIFDRHAGRIHAYLTRRVGRDHAEALLGEAFRVAFERRATYRTDRPDCGPWLYGIASNLVLQHVRREGRQRDLVSRLSPHGRGEPDHAAEVEDRLDAGSLWARVASAIDALDPRDREVALLFAWEELSYAEIAEALDIPVGTVRSRLSRARRLLREALPADEGVTP